MLDIEHWKSNCELSSEDALYLVTIAGSAGAISPLIQLLGRLPVDFRAALGIIVHSGPQSHLAEALQQRVHFPVLAASSGMQLRPGRAYAPPGGSHLVINPDGSLAAPCLPRLRQFRPSADWLFESAAASFGSRHVAIVLSGMLADGASRLRLVKSCGGRVLAQHPDECTHPDMPRAAISTGCADWVLPVGLMPGVLFSWLEEQDDERQRLAWESPFEHSL